MIQKEKGQPLLASQRLDLAGVQRGIIDANIIDLTVDKIDSVTIEPAASNSSMPVSLPGTSIGHSLLETPIDIE